VEITMSPRSLLAVIFALVFGGSAAVGVSSYVKNQGPQAANPDMAQVVVTSMDVPRGSMITADQIKIRDIPKDQVHPLAIRKIDDAVNRAVITPLIKDEPLLEGKLAPKGSRGSMAWVTKPGMRAFTIHTPSLASGVAGFVMPGDHIDVLLTMNGEPKDGSGGGSTTTLLQNVEVMAVDQRIDAPAENKVDLNQLRSVTLQVTPDQSLLLDLGQNKGTLHLSLRNPEDTEDAQTRPATLADLRYRQEPPEVAEPEPAPAPAIVEAPPPAPPQRFVYVYRSAVPKMIRIEKHSTDGNPAEAIEAATENAPTVEFR
jgi:pilus assembly protein CpaB